MVGHSQLHLVNETHCHPFVKDRSKAKMILSWADLGDLVIKRVFETGLGSRHAVMTRLLIEQPRLHRVC